MRPFSIVSKVGDASVPLVVPLEFEVVACLQLMIGEEAN